MDSCSSINKVFDINRDLVIVIQLLEIGEKEDKLWFYGSWARTF